MTGTFAPGDRVQLTGHKGRRNTITLQAGGVFHSHRGMLAHELLIGAPTAPRTSRSSRCWRTT
jgi:tRNA (adenine57-N1/adenine58-N1)-methyltransferase catalytic subunit